MLLNNFTNLILKNASSYKKLLVLLIFYLVAHGGLLFISDAIFWDDWTLFRTEPSTILENFKQAGSMLLISGYLHVGLLKIGPWTYKLLTLILMFASGLLLNKILESFEEISEDLRFVIVLIFLVLPINIARVALIDFPYTACYFLFFLAWFLIDRFRITALIIFFIIFTTNSLLVFYALPILAKFYKNKCQLNSSEILKFCFRNLDFILLPFVYFYIKTSYFKPYGLYAGYNETYGFMNILYSVYTQSIDLLNLKINIATTLIFLIFSLTILKKYSPRLELKSDAPLKLFTLGLFISAIGSFPYWILGHVPTFLEWTSRHQLLLPLGLSISIASLLSYKKSNIVVLSTIVGTSLAINAHNYKDFFVDWQKQKQLIELFSMNSSIKKASLVVINDKTEGLNAIGRRYRFYEWNGLFEYAFGDQKRFGINHSDLHFYMNGHNQNGFFTAAYKAGSFNKDDQHITYVEIISSAPKNLKEKFFALLIPRLEIIVKN